MDRGTHESFLLTDLGELGAVEAENVGSQSGNTIRTVYTQLPAGLEQSGYRHIYVTVDTPSDLSTLAGPFTTQQEVSLNQSNIVTVAVPASQYISDAGGTIIIQQPGGGVPAETTIPSSEHDKQHAQIIFSEVSGASEVSVAEHKESQVFVTAPSEKQTGGQAESEATPTPTDNRVTFTLSQPDTHSESVQIAKVSDKELASLTNSHQSIADRPNAPVPLVVCRCDARKNNTRTEQPIFTSVQANLASRLMETIPGCSSTFLHQFVTQHDMTLQQEQDTASLSVCGDLHKVLCLHDNLSQLVSTSGSSQQSASTSQLGQQAVTPGGTKGVMKDKAVLCDILQPQFSRSGRQIKRKNLEHPMEKEDNMSVESFEVSVSIRTPPVTGKKKRGRPPKNAKAREANKTQESQVEIMDIPKADLKKLESESTHQGGITLQAVSLEEALVQGETEVKSETLDPEERYSLLLASGNPNEKEPVEDPQEGHLDSTTKEASLEEDSSHSDQDGPDTNGLSEKENTQERGTTGIVKKELRSNTGGSFTSLKPPFGRRRHKKDYESLAPFKFHCSMCSFKSKRKSHYLKHLLVHSKKGLPVLPCSQCSFTTIRLSHLRRHQLSHSAQVYNCKVCNYKTDDMKRLSRHHRIKHVTGPVESDVQVYECQMCEYKTLKSHQYYRHLRCHSSLCGDPTGQTSSSYQCPLCPYKTQRKEHYSRHATNVHTDRRPYLCDLCGKAFKRPDALRQHKLVHQDKLSRPCRYTCQDCLKGFRSHAHLMEHRTIHTDERSYLCEICGAAFKTRSVQRKHVQTIHQNPRAHSCSSCDKRFNTKYALQRHLRTHNTQGMRTLSLAMETLGADGAGTTVAVLSAAEGVEETAHIIQELQGTAAQEEETIATAETIATIAVDSAGGGAMEGQYDEGGEGTVRQLPQTAYIQTTNEATTALLYLTSLPSY